MLHFSHADMSIAIPAVYWDGIIEIVDFFLEDEVVEEFLGMED